VGENPREASISFGVVSPMLATLGRVVAMALLVGLGAGAGGSRASCQEGEPKQFRAEPMRTGKERLGGKSTDEQRVDNCKVPLELRGLKPRPDGCVDAASTTSRR
jgi:hypothetical protein